MAREESSDSAYALVPEPELRRLAQNPPPDSHLRAQIAAELLRRSQDRRVTGPNPVQPRPISMKNARDWLLILAAPLCVAPMGFIALRIATLVPQSSFATWVGLELAIFVSSALAIGLSLWRFPERPIALKILSVATIVAAGVLGPLEAFWLL